MMEQWSIRFRIVFVTYLAIAWSVGFSFAFDHPQQHLYKNDDDSSSGKICQRIAIWDWPDFETMLRGCTVVEGSLQINIIFSHSDVQLNLTFPELREITGFLMVFNTPNLVTLKTLFPNLAVIRGQELVEDYALVVYKMPGMKEIGLPSLTNILRGEVWIVDNENMCYVSTVEWSKIMNASNTIDANAGIFKNKQQCPDTCPDCPTSDNLDIYSKRNLCWSKDLCQVVPHISCPSKCGGSPCFGEKSDLKCCHKQCLGGCFGSEPDQCHVCKGVVVNRPGSTPICSDKCPSGFYEYLNRRCVSANECLNITSRAPINHPRNPSGHFNGKWFTAPDETQMCVLECPKDTELAPNGTACISCFGTCKKNCNGRIVDTVEAARELNGCTRITGALKIHIRRGSSSTHGTIVKALKENLDKIEEIDHYLAVTYTYSIYSLDFLSSLKVIRGKELDDKKYALVIKSNENLMELWNGTESLKRNITIENKNARVLFHYNPKLCPYKIWEFVIQAGIKPPARDDNIDIGITNGDKAPCNTKTLQIDIRHRSNSTVVIRWENFRRNLTLTSHLLNYEIHYKEALYYPKRNESKFENRDPCGDDGWNVQEQAKISDNEVKYQHEPEYENEALIANLKPYTYYALYVKAIVIQDAYALNNNTGAESDIKYFRTYALNPQPPQNFRLATSGPDKITVSWEPPSIVNGELTSFEIYIKSVPENQEQQDQRNYCDQGRPLIVGNGNSNSKGTDSFITTTFAPMIPSSAEHDCCSCSAPSPTRPFTKNEIIDNVNKESNMLDIVMGNYLFVSISGSGSRGGYSSTEEDPQNNEIRKSRRRRREIIEKEHHSTTSDEVTEHEKPDIFPEGANHKPLDHIIIPDPEEKNLTFRGEIPYNSSISKYTFVLSNLTHYTQYYVGIKACRAIDPDITSEVDKWNCSTIRDEPIKTAPSPTADIIEPRTVFLNTTDNRIHVRWAEPLHPNGVIMGYNIKVYKVGIGKEDLWGKDCITRQQFLKNGKNYTFPNNLAPGNYSLHIQAASLAQDSEVMVVQYFYIADISEKTPGFWVLVILLPFMLIVLIASCFAYWMLKRHLNSGKRIVSANPEYMPNVDIAEEWEVPRDQIKLIKELGQGSFGTVFLGKLTDFVEGNPELFCAVKTVADETPSEERALFLKEAALMTKLDCNHVVKLLGIVSKTQPIYVIMELMENGDLKQYLRSRRPDAEKKNAHPPPTLKQILRIAAEIADGMMFIHSEKLVHRDLAARNCLVHANMTVKVGDFGMTKEITDYYRKQTRGLLPVRWMAPESLRDGVFTSQSDVWSFGVVLWEMATLAAQPYQGLSNSQVLEFVQSGRVMDMPEKCPQILYELMAGCWEYDHRRRPTFIEILERLTPFLEPSFAQVSFYHSAKGIDFRKNATLRTMEEDTITIRTPLMATFDVFEDDIDDYNSDDDQPGLSHHIVDDLGDSSSRRLLSSTPVKPQIIEPGSSPLHKSYVENGVPLTPLSISGNSSYLKNGSSPTYSSVPSTQPTSLFSNPPLRSNISTTPTTTNSNNNYTEALFSTPLSTNTNCVPPNYSIPLTPVKANDVKFSNKPDRPTNNKSPITYTSITPVSQTNITAKNNGGGDTSNSNDSSNSFSVNCVGDSHKFGNGTNTGGNGYILPVTGNQRNKTTQF